MKLANFSFSVQGGSYEDLIDKAEEKISDFIDQPLDQLNKYVSYEIDISENSSVAKTTYEAKVNARIKNV